MAMTTTPAQPQPSGTTMVEVPKSVSAAHTVVARKVYGIGEAAVTALGSVSVQLDRGESTAIMGPSVSGWLSPGPLRMRGSRRSPSRSRS